MYYTQSEEVKKIVNQIKEKINDMSYNFTMTNEDYDIYIKELETIVYPYTSKNIIPKGHFTIVDINEKTGILSLKWIQDNEK